MADITENGIKRREFVTAAAVVGVCAMAGALPALAADAPAGVDVGALTDYSKDGVTTTWVHDHHLIVARENGKIYAMSSKCTHRNCDLDDATDHLNCHCHGSNFAYDGTVSQGPARKSLPRFAISANDSGHLLVDVKTQFDDQHWDDPKSFVALPKS